jgi:TP901 family phage tail tape measure protein
MADIQYTAKIIPDVDSMRKSIEAGLRNLGFSIDQRSYGNISAEIQNQVRPRLLFAPHAAGLRQLKTAITTGIGEIPVKFVANTTGLAQQIRNSTQAIAVDVTINDSRQAFKNLGKVTDAMAGQFTKMSTAKDKFAANVQEKFPLITNHVKNLNEHLDRTVTLLKQSGSARLPRTPKAPAAPSTTATTPSGVPIGPKAPVTEERAVNTARQRQREQREQLRANNRELQEFAGRTTDAAKATDFFAGRVGFTTARLAAYLLPATAIFQLTRGLSVAREQITDINRSITQLIQIMGGDIERANRIATQTIEIAEMMGQSARDVLNITKFLAQAGETFNTDSGLVAAVQAIAASNLGATFGDIQETVKGGVAYLNQFKLSAEDLVGVLDTANTLSRDFAVEAGDLFTAVQTGGAAFATFGGRVEEFQALVTTLRQLTRLPVATIGTGLNTIILSTFSPKNLSFIRQMGIQVDDTAGNFRGMIPILSDVGAAFKNLSQEQKNVVATKLFDVRQSKLGIPLLEDLGNRNVAGPKGKSASVFEQAIQSAKNSTGSLFRDADTGLRRFDAQFQQVGTRFQEVFAKIAEDQGFLQFIRELTTGLKLIVSLLGTAAPLIPSFLRIGTVVALISTIRSSKRFVGGIQEQLSGGRDIAPPGAAGVVTSPSGKGGGGRPATTALRSIDVNTQALQRATEATNELTSTMRVKQAAPSAPIPPAASNAVNRTIKNALEEKLSRQSSNVTALNQKIAQGVSLQQFTGKSEYLKTSIGVANQQIAQARSLLKPQPLKEEFLRQSMSLGALRMASARGLTGTDIAKTASPVELIKARALQEQVHPPLTGDVRRRQEELLSNALLARHAFRKELGEVTEKRSETFGLEQQRNQVRAAALTTVRELRNLPASTLGSAADPTARNLNNPRANLQLLHAGRGDVIAERQRTSEQFSKINKTTGDFRRAVSLIDRNLGRNTELQSRLVSEQSLRSTLSTTTLARANRQGITGAEGLLSIASPREKALAVQEELKTRGRPFSSEELRKAATPKDIGQAVAGAAKTQQTQLGPEFNAYRKNLLRAASSLEVVTKTNASLSASTSQLAERQHRLTVEEARLGVAIERETAEASAAGGSFLQRQQATAGTSPLPSIRGRAGKAIRSTGGALKRFGSRIAGGLADASPYLGAFALDAAVQNFIPGELPITNNTTGALLSNAGDIISMNRRNATTKGAATGIISGAVAGSVAGPIGTVVGAIVGGAISGLVAYKTSVDETRQSLLTAASSASTFADALKPFTLLLKDVGSVKNVQDVLHDNSPASGAFKQRLRGLTGEFVTRAATSGDVNSVTGASLARFGDVRKNLISNLQKQIADNLRLTTSLSPEEIADKSASAARVLEHEVDAFAQKTFAAAAQQKALNEGLTEFHSKLNDLLKSLNETKENAASAAQALKSTTQQRQDTFSTLLGKGQNPIVNENLADIISNNLRLTAERGNLTESNAPTLSLGLLNREEQKTVVLSSQLTKTIDSLFQGFIADVDRAQNLETESPKLAGEFRSRVNTAFAKPDFGPGAGLSEAQTELIQRARTALDRQVLSENLDSFRGQDPKKLRENFFGDIGNTLDPTIETFRTRLVQTGLQLEANQQAYENERQVIEQFGSALDKSISSQFNQIGRLRSIGVSEPALLAKVGAIGTTFNRPDVGGATERLTRAQADFTRASAPLTQILKASGKLNNPIELERGIASALRNGLGPVNLSQARALSDVTGSTESQNLVKLLEFKGRGQAQKLPDDIARLVAQGSATFQAAGGKNLTQDQINTSLNEAVDSFTKLAQSGNSFLQIQNTATDAFNRLTRAQDNYHEELKNSERAAQNLNETFNILQGQLSKTLQTNTNIGRASMTDISQAQIGFGQAQAAGVVRGFGNLTSTADLAKIDPAQATAMARAFASLPDAIAQQIEQSFNLLGNRKITAAGLTGTQGAEIFSTLRGAGRLGNPEQNVAEIQNGFGQLFDINQQMRDLEDVQVHAMLDIARNTGIMAEAILNLQPNSILQGAVNFLTRGSGGTIPTQPPENVPVSDTARRTGNINEGELARLNSQLATLPNLIALLESATRDHSGQSKSLIDTLKHYTEEVRTSGGKASNVDVSADINVTGFEDVGRDIAVKAIVVGVMENFLRQLGDTPGEMQLRDKLTLALKQIQTGSTRR